MKGVCVSLRKTKWTTGLGSAEDNEMTKTKKKIWGPRVAMGRSNDDASYEDFADPPYKPRDEESSESELDEQWNKGCVQDWVPKH